MVLRSVLSRTATLSRRNVTGIALSRGIHTLGGNHQGQDDGGNDFNWQQPRGADADYGALMTPPILHNTLMKLDKEETGQDVEDKPEEVSLNDTEKRIINFIEASITEPWTNAPENGTLSNKETREWYVEQEANIVNLLDTEFPLRYQAYQAFIIRNKVRSKARDLMADREAADKLNATEKNLTWDQLVQRQKDKGLEDDEIYSEIIASSQRSRKSVNDALGVKPKGEKE